MSDDLETVVAGSTPIVRFAYTNAAGDVGDPPELTIRYRRLYDTATAKVWHVDDEVVRDSEGNFHIDVPCPTAGTWVAQADDGAGALAEITWVVEESSFG